MKGVRESEKGRVREREREPDINNGIVRFRNRENERNENGTKKPYKTILQG